MECVPLHCWILVVIDGLVRRYTLQRVNPGHDGGEFRVSDAQFSGANNIMGLSGVCESAVPRRFGIEPVCVRAAHDCGADTVALFLTVFVNFTVISRL